MGPHGRQNAPPSSTRGKLSVPKSPIPEAEDGEGELEVELLLATISEQELRPVSARARVFIELPLSITGVAIPQQLFFSGVVRGESAMRSERDVGSKVKYEVTVSNQGQSLNTLGSAFLNIMWPHEIANGKWLLYPMRVELEGGQGPGQKGLCSPRPNALYLDVDSRDRRRRELGQPEQPEPREQPEPSTSWWPVSSAEKKKNVTLVRAGQTWCSQNGGGGAWYDRGCGWWGGNGASGRWVARGEVRWSDSWAS
nr:integrin alpha-7 [Camelus dromedarius]